MRDTERPTTPATTIPAPARAHLVMLPAPAAELFDIDTLATETSDTIVAPPPEEALPASGVRPARLRDDPWGYTTDRELLQLYRRVAGAILPARLVRGWQRPTVRGRGRAKYIAVGFSWVDYILTTSPNDFARHDDLLQRGMAMNSRGEVVTLQRFCAGDY